MERCSGRTAQSTRAFGGETNRLERGSSIMLMETFLKASGATGRLVSKTKSCISKMDLSDLTPKKSNIKQKMEK